MKKLVVLVSGSGTNLQAVIDAIQAGTLKNTRISLVVSNRTKAYGLVRATFHDIPTAVHLLKGRSRTEYDSLLADAILRASPDLIVLAGFMHILSTAFLSRVVLYSSFIIL